MKFQIIFKIKKYRKICCFILFLLFLFIYSFSFSQHRRPSEKVLDENKYGSPTKWSCIDKHFGYYFVNFAVPIPINNSIENYGKSGHFRAGYIYRYKIVKPFDIGVELAYSARYSGIKKNNYFYLDNENSKMRTLNNSVEGTLFLRFNLKQQTHRALGSFIDIGGYYDFSFGRNILYVSKTKYIVEKTKLRNPEYLSNQDYGMLLRFGYNYIAIFANYSFGKWINNITPQNLTFKRSPLIIGIQLNLYTK